MAKEKKQELSITVKKEEDISKWYTQVIQKADLMDYSKVAGCIVFKPNSYQIWEQIQQFFDKKIKESGVKNAYFPMLIPESLLTKEEDHVEGFTPEVAWVTQTGNTELKERLAVRPTSETVMYDSYSKWIQSYRDLPLRLNQWNSVVRWEFKHATPFFRTREFLWQEGHTAFATKKEADAEVLEMLGYYAQVYEELLAIPVDKGRKSIGEKFAGAQYTTTVEAIAEDGKSIQAGTSHHLGQNFAKAFDISYLDKDQKKQFVWQNSWGLSTRAIGAMIMMHSDNNGLVLPPRVAHNKVVIVPLLFKGKEQKVLQKANELKEQLKEFNPILDDDSKESAGFKFNKWELRGIPLRIEIGPKDIENNEITIVQRDTLEKTRTKLNMKLFNFKNNNCKEDKKLMKRENVAIILENDKEEILCLNWHNEAKWHSFIIGGQDNLDIKEAAQKEIIEETGYQNFEFVKELNIETHDKFYAVHKDVNRYAVTKTLVYKLKDDKKEEVSQKEKNLHTPIWIKKDKVMDYLNLDAMKAIYKEYLGEKQKYDPINLLIKDTLNTMQKRLYDNAKKLIDSKTIEVNNIEDFKKAIQNKKRCLVPWAESIESEDEIKELTGAKSSCIPFKYKTKSLKGIKCFYSGKPATCWAYFAKSH
jgi:prolyl-tRNA synthetase